MKVTIIRKEKHDYGVNTYLSNGYILSSMLMEDGSTSYNVYKESIDEDNLIEEDSYVGYWRLLKTYSLDMTPEDDTRYILDKMMETSEEDINERNKEEAS